MFLADPEGYMKGLLKELRFAPLTALQPQRTQVEDENTLERWHERLRIDLVAKTVLLDGVRVGGVDHAVLLILMALLEARGGAVRQQALNKLPGLRKARIDRILKKAPKPLADIVKSHTGVGFWLVLPG